MLKKYLTTTSPGTGKPQRSYLPASERVPDEVLLMDPLTQLVCYDSMSRYVAFRLAIEEATPCFLAIGDVDGLREYVWQQNRDSETVFGHVAGNHCMKMVGSTVNEWVSHQPLEMIKLCGTFGGDEVIIFSEGGTFEQFVESIEELSESLAVNCPRPCSFACSYHSRNGEAVADAQLLYRSWVSRTDRALFEAKESHQRDHDKSFIVTC